MTIIRIGREAVHPFADAADGRAESGDRGDRRAGLIIGPQPHSLLVDPEWCEAYLDAAAYLAPRIMEQAGGRLDQDLAIAAGRWMIDPATLDGAIDTLPVRWQLHERDRVLSYRPSRTLVLTDMIENFEPQKLGLFARALTWLGGAQHPDGKMPRDMRLTYRARAAELRVAIDTMIGWDPARIIPLAHGRWYERGGCGRVRRAFRWLLNS